MNVPTALTVAGSDPVGGAGLQADIKTFTALGVYGMGVVTSITVQNTEGVFKVFHVPPQLVYEQIEAVVNDVRVGGTKTGMLGNEEIAVHVAKAVRDFRIENLVVDPVLRSSSGADLLEGCADVLMKELLPLALLVTPNVPEAEVLCGVEIRRLRDVEVCAKELLKTGVKAVLIKGGHMKGDKVIDVLYTGGEEFHYFVGDRVNAEVHGTGCTLSAAVTTFLAKGYSLVEAVKNSKDYVQKTIERRLSLGKGSDLPNHMWSILK